MISRVILKEPKIIVHPNGKPGYVQTISYRSHKVDYESTNIYGVGGFCWQVVNYLNFPMNEPAH